MFTLIRLLRRRPIHRGQAMAEMAIALPILFLFIFGLIELGLMIKTKMVLQDAVRAAVRYGMLAGTDTGANGCEADLAMLDTMQNRLSGTLVDTNRVRSIFFYASVSSGDGPSAGNGGNNPTVALTNTQISGQSFTPPYPGKLFGDYYYSDYSLSTGGNIGNGPFVIRTLGSPSSGGFTLTVNGATTGSIGPTATAAAIQSALGGLSSVPGGAGNVQVSGTSLNAGPVTVTFLNAAVGLPITLGSSTLSPGSVSISGSGTGQGAIYKLFHNQEGQIFVTSSVTPTTPLYTDTDNDGDGGILANSNPPGDTLSAQSAPDCGSTLVTTSAWPIYDDSQHDGTSSYAGPSYKAGLLDNTIGNYPPMLRNNQRDFPAGLPDSFGVDITYDYQFKTPIFQVIANVLIGGTHSFRMDERSSDYLSPQ